MQEQRKVLPTPIVAGSRGVTREATLGVPCAGVWVAGSGSQMPPAHEHPPEEVKPAQTFSVSLVRVPMPSPSRTPRRKDWILRESDASLCHVATGTVYREGQYHRVPGGYEIMHGGPHAWASESDCEVESSA